MSALQISTGPGTATIQEVNLVPETYQMIPSSSPSPVKKPTALSPRVLVR